MAAIQQMMMGGYVDPHTFASGPGFYDNVTFGAGSAGIAVRLDSDGICRQTTASTGTTSHGPWITPQTNMSDYEVMFDNESGTISVTSGSFGAWLQLNIDRGVSCALGAYGTVSGLCRVRIRHAITQVVVHEATWDLLANAEF